jgi:hypothetical protein
VGVFSQETHLPLVPWSGAAGDAPFLSSLGSGLPETHPWLKPGAVLSIGSARRRNPWLKPGAVLSIGSARRQQGAESEAQPSLGLGSRVGRTCTKRARPPSTGAGFNLRFLGGSLPLASARGALPVRMREQASISVSSGEHCPLASARGAPTVRMREQASSSVPSGDHGPWLQPWVR